MGGYYQPIGPWATFQYKDRLSQAWDSHVKDKTAVRPSYPNMGIPILVEQQHLYIETAPGIFPTA